MNLSSEYYKNLFHEFNTDLSYYIIFFKDKQSTISKSEIATQLLQLPKYQPLTTYLFKEVNELEKIKNSLLNFIISIDKF